MNSCLAKKSIALRFSDNDKTTYAFKKRKLLAKINLLTLVSVKQIVSCNDTHTVAFRRPKVLKFTLILKNRVETIDFFKDFW